MKSNRVILLDHYDSFTYNLLQYLAELGGNPRVLRTDVKIEDVKALDPTHIVLSPGPGYPRDVALFLEAILYFQGNIPILGVCLGHQAIAYNAGMCVKKNYRLMHGKASLIYHVGEGIFEGLPNPFEAGRYHSLIVERESIDINAFKIMAWTDENEVMGIQCLEYPSVVGVQFHPESYLTEEGGKKLLANFLNL